MPTTENCDLLKKIEELHCLTLMNIRVNYQDHLTAIDNFLINLEAFACYHRKLIKNTVNNFNSAELEQISLCLCENQASSHKLISQRGLFIEYLIYHLVNQGQTFKREKGNS